MFTILHVTIYVLSLMFVLFVLYGFWQGLSLRPNAPEHRPSDDHGFWGGGHSY